MTDTQEDLFPALTSQDGQKCLRHSPCRQAACLTCYPPETGSHHVRDLSQDLGTSPGSKTKPTTKPTAPPDHIISVITEDFKQAFPIMTKYVKTTRNLTKPQTQIPSAPTTLPTHHLPAP